MQSCIYCLYTINPEIHSIYFCLTPFCCEYNTILILYHLLNAYSRYIALSMACWQVVELCGPVDHSSPAHPGAVACVFGLQVFKTPEILVNSVLTREACEISLCPVCKMPKVFFSLTCVHHLPFSIVTVILLIGILYCLHVVIIVKGLFRVALLCPVVLSTVLLSP